MITPEMVAEITETGKLNVYFLKRFWSQRLLPLGGRAAAPRSAEDLALDTVILSGLGLAIEETMRYLGTEKPTFDTFEDWILKINGGSIAPERIARINAAAMKTAPPAAVQDWLHHIETSDPVLNADDLAFWDENGYVILHDAISPEECRIAETAVWEYLQMDRDRPESWYEKNIGQGIMVQMFHHPIQRAIRTSPRIHKAFAQVWHTPDLWVTNDRVSFNPPEYGKWRFPGPHLHWDTSLIQPMPFCTQGLMYLTDTPAEQGAFTCVPGFQRTLADWLDRLPPDADPRKQDFERLGATPIAGKAGDLIIWNDALPHGSRPNQGSRPRFVQYINMTPVMYDYRTGWR
jgi:ectoine hydroxylase-related dioxygenase (phytanoyl-CoA dioxygenase family)